MQISFRRVLLATNVFLLITAMFFVALFVLYKVSPRTVNDLGAKRIESYILAGATQKEQALAAVRSGAPDKATSLLKKWSDIQKGDRYYEYKRDVFIALSEYWAEKKEYVNTIDMSEIFRREDDRDLIVFKAWSEAALNHPKYIDDAYTEIYERWDQLPQSVVLSELYLRYVLDWNDSEKVSEAINRSAFFDAQTVKSAGWAVYWTDKQGFSGDKVQNPNLGFSGETRILTISVPSTIRRVRIDPPAGSLLQLSNFSVSIKNTKMPYSLTDLEALHMVTISGDKLVTTGGNDPYFAIDLTELTQVFTQTDQIDIDIIFQALASPPQWLAQKLETFTARE